jgi:hypothetical protein
MAQFFRKSIDQHLFSGSSSALAAERLRFKQNQVSGVFEIQSHPDEFELLVLGDGEETGAYRLHPDSHVKIPVSEIGASWEKEEVPIRSMALPDQASRAIWQALEFQNTSQQEVKGVAGWKTFLDHCFSERITGMVGIASDLGDGFVFLKSGLPASGETIFCTSEGFTNNLQTAQGLLQATNQLTLYTADPTTQAYQCTLLRLGVVGWGGRILANYKDLVGQKLLHVLNANLNAMLMHQQSNIYLADIDIIDNHFFSECKAAAEVYQTLFLDLAQMIGRVIGSMVTRRIITSTFERLALNEQEIIKTNTLAPAAFLR